MKYLNKFNESISHLHGVAIVSLCKKYGIKDYILNDDGSIDVYDNLVDIPIAVYKIAGGVKFYERLKLDKIPIKFNRVENDFYFSNSKIKDLENCPKYVGKKFMCINNELTTLLGGPEYVGGDYLCYNNKLTDVYGFPEIFNGNLLLCHGGIKKFGNEMNQDNPVNEIIDIIESRKGISNVRFVHLLNYNKVIRNGNIIIQDRLEESLYGLGLKPGEILYLLTSRGGIHYPINERFKHYKVI